MAGRPLTGDVAARIRALETERYDAMQRGDAEHLRRLFHDDLVYMHSSGHADGADSYVSRMSSGDLVYHRVHSAIERHLVLGGTCLLWGTMTADITVGGTDKRISSTALSVWTAVDGDWLLVAYHPTPVPAA